MVSLSFLGVIRYQLDRRVCGDVCRFRSCAISNILDDLVYCAFAMQVVVVMVLQDKTWVSLRFQFLTAVKF
jgi:hypothetical protein